MRVGGRGDRIPGYMGRLRDEREPASGRWGQAVASWVVARGVTVIFWTDLPGKAKRAQRAESAGVSNAATALPRNSSQTLSWFFSGLSRASRPMGCASSSPAPGAGEAVRELPCSVSAVDPVGQSPPASRVAEDVRSSAIYLRADHRVGALALIGAGLGGASLMMRALSEDAPAVGAAAGVALCCPSPGVRPDELAALPPSAAASSVPLLLLFDRTSERDDAAAASARAASPNSRHCPRQRPCARAPPFG